MGEKVLTAGDVQAIILNPRLYVEQEFVKQDQERAKNARILDFSGLTISGILQFAIEGTSPDKVIFDHVTFIDDVEFNFRNQPFPFSFKDTKFKKNFKLGPNFYTNTNSQKYGKLDFSFAEFFGKGEFDSVCFGDHVCFKRTIFHNEANFQNTIFLSNAIFDGVEFHGKVDFSTTSDIRPDLRKEVPSKPASIQGKISFENARFLNKNSNIGYPDFSNRIFENITTFYSATFNLPPNFNNSRLFHFTDFRKSEFKNHEYESASYYQTLKRLMGEARDYRTEGHFHAYEHRCLRKGKWRGMDWLNPRFYVQWIISWLYCLTAEYGQNSFLPFLWLVLFNIVVGFYYSVYWCWSGITGLELFYKSEVFTIAQLFRPLSDFPKEFSQIPVTWKIYLPIVSVFQSLLSVSLTALFLLTLRKRFRLHG